MFPQSTAENCEVSILPPSCPLRQIKGFADGAAIEAKPGSGERRGCEVALSQHRLVGGNTLLRLTSPLLVPTEKGREMPRDLFEATMRGWARLNDRQRQRFFEAGLKAALRLERREFREWLRRRVSEPPLAAPVDAASFAISKADIALLIRSAREVPLKKTPQRNLGNQKC
jgi:hypothetical protein